MRKNCGKNVFIAGMKSDMVCIRRWTRRFSPQAMWEYTLFSTPLSAQSPHPLPHVHQPVPYLVALALSTISTMPTITGANKEKKGYNR